MKQFICIIVFGLLACACQIPFSIDNISEPRFFVELIPAAGEDATTMKIAYAIPAYGEKPAEFYKLDTNDINLEINGKRVAAENLEWENRGESWKTGLPCRFAAEDRVSVTVSGNKVPTASASTVIPEPPVISSVDISKIEEKKEEEDSYGRRVVVKLDRDVVDGEYYGIEILLQEEMYFARLTMGMPPTVLIDTIKYENYISPGQIASMSDINNMDLDAFASVSYRYGGLLSEGDFYMLDEIMFSAYRPMSLLGARQFDGNSYSFYINADFSIGDMLGGMDFGDEDYIEPQQEFADGEKLPDDPEEPTEFMFPLGSKTWYQIEVFRLSDELYNYCKAQYLKDYNILSNFGVTPPNFTYSNVSGGLGIVGGISRCKTELIPDPFNKEPEIPNLWDLLNELSK